MPKVSFEGELGEDDDEGGREPVCVYLMNRIPGMTKLEFTNNSGLGPMNEEFLRLNREIAVDMAR